MNDENVTEPANPDDNVPPRKPTSQPTEASAQVTHEFEPMAPGQGLGGVLSTLLQRPGRLVYQLHQPGSVRLTIALAVVAIVCLGLYGLLVGSFSGHEQLWVSPAKIVSGAIISALICVPSLYVFTCLSGVSDRVRLGSLVGVVMAALAIEGLLLLSFAPVAWVFSESTYSVAFISTLHLILWAISLYFGLRVIGVGMKYLNAAELGYLAVWYIIFGLVTLQMMTALRPLVGRSEKLLPEEKTFFLLHWRDVLDHEIRADGTRQREESILGD
jgi:hypothetical protein